MADKQRLDPGPNHPISIQSLDAHLQVIVGGKIIAETRKALVLKEMNYSPVYYVPREDVKMHLLESTNHETYCPYKGECSYYSIPAGGDRSANAVWTYEEPFSAVSPIQSLLAFYPDRVDAIQVL